MGDAFLAVLDAALRSTILLGVMGTAAWFWRHGSASARCWLWTVGVAGMLVMPFVVRTTPTYSVPLEIVPTPVRAGITETPSEHGQGAVRPTPTAGTLGGTRHADPVPPSGRDAVSVVLLAAGVWLAGVTIFAVRLLRGWLTITRWRQTARAVEDSTILSAARHACRQLALTRMPPLRYSSRTTVPLVCGWFRPTVLLPTSFPRWDVGMINTALLHELAHVKRGDGTGQLVAAAAVCLYWFHPGSWLADRALAMEREAACDETVLRTGVDPVAYATDLLAITRRVNADPGTLAMAMSGRKGLERRLQNVLEWVPPHIGWHRTRQMLGVQAAVVLIIALGGFRMPSPHREGSTKPTGAIAGPPVLRAPDGSERRVRLGERDTSRFPGDAASNGITRLERERSTRRAVVASSTVHEAIAPQAPITAWDDSRSLHVPIRRGICGSGIPNEITVSRASERGCDARTALIELTVRDGAPVAVDATVGGVGLTSRPTINGAETAARLLDVAATLPSNVGPNAVQAAAMIDGPDITDRLLALARRSDAPPSTRRMATVWAEALGGAAAHAGLLSLLLDDSADISVREQVIIALGAAALPDVRELAKGASSQRMRLVAAHRLALALPVGALLDLYPTLPDAAARLDVVDRVAERGTEAQRAHFSDLLTREPDADVRVRALARLRRSSA